MNYLLDAHVVIWYLENSAKLPPTIIEIIDDPKNRICICTVSLWEIAIKITIGKMTLKSTFDQFLDSIETRDFDLLYIENDYLKVLAALPFIHRDPFDRMLVATALVKDLTIITADDNIHKYDVAWIW
jgi:PIN domain nuclease of toxin-antitoxin system